MNPVFRIVLFACLVTTPCLVAAPQLLDVNVNVVLTKPGKKLAPPTRANPAYYHSVFAGFQEEGRVVAGEKPPSQDWMTQQLKRALTNRGYFPYLPEERDSPSLQLVFLWGAMNPLTEGGTNEDQMMKLVGGVNLKQQEDDDRAFGIPSTRTIRSKEQYLAEHEAQDDRYFLMIVAYDLGPILTREKFKKKLLWTARASTPSAKVSSFQQVAHTLIENLAPFLGRETMPPQRLQVPLVREVKVDVGPTEVVPALPNQKPSPPPHQP